MATISGRITSTRPNFHDVPKGLVMGSRYRFSRDHMTALKGEEVVVSHIGALIGFEAAPGSGREYMFSLRAHEVRLVLEPVK